MSASGTPRRISFTKHIAAVAASHASFHPANANNKAALLEALGDPDEVSKLGPIESWTYKAANGEVSFVITGDIVALKATADSEKKK